MVSDLPRELARALRRLSVDLADALSEITVPAFVLDAGGELRWLNAAAIEAFGDRRGEHYSAVVAPDAQHVVANQFSRKLVGAVRATSYEAVLLGRDGRRRLVEIHSVRLQERGHAVGVFGLVDVEQVLGAADAGELRLTPRQLEVLGLLAGGRSTDQIADQLHVARETVRNHVRGILRALGAHSRLEAVAQARMRGIV